MRKNRDGQKRRNTSGFTLVELILVTAIISVITLALYQALSNGIRIWERSRVMSVEEDVLIFFDKLSMDLENAFDFSLFDFKGGSQSIAFSTLVRVPVGRAGDGKVEAYVDQIGRVEYGYDAAHKAIYRRQANYGQAVKGKFGDAKILAQPVSKAVFSYYRRNIQGLTTTVLDKKKLPMSVGVQVFYGGSGRDPRKLKRLINLPLSF